MSTQSGASHGLLKGRVALVTCAARGIGRAIALCLSERGALIAANFRTGQADAEGLARSIKEAGGECLLVPGGVGTEEEAAGVVQQVLNRWGRLDILVNNPGITRDRSARKSPADDWADVISVNLNGAYYCAQAALPAMIAQNHGRIINVSPHPGASGEFGQSSRQPNGSILNFGLELALETARHNVTVNTVLPGFTCTEILASIPPGILDQIRGGIPLQRFGAPEEIAATVGFLAGEGGYITGQQFHVDGGLHMRAGLKSQSATAAYTAAGARRD